MQMHKGSFKAVLLKTKSSGEEGKEVSAGNTKISESFAEFYIHVALDIVTFPFVIVPLDVWYIRSMSGKMQVII